MHTSTRTLFWRRQDQLAGKSTHSLTKKSVPELNDQPTYISAGQILTFKTHYCSHQNNKNKIFLVTDWSNESTWTKTNRHEKWSDMYETCWTGLRYLICLVSESKYTSTQLQVFCNYLEVNYFITVSSQCFWSFYLTIFKCCFSCKPNPQIQSWNILTIFTCALIADRPTYDFCDICWSSHGASQY